MSIVTVFFVLLYWVALPALLAVALFVVGRIIFLSTRIGAFRTLLRVPRQTNWRRGYARYGRHNLAWNSLIRLGMSPDLLLPRSSLEVLGVSHNAEVGTTLLRLRSEDREYQLILSTGDYAGLVSWVDSSPPQEAPIR